MFRFIASLLAIFLSMAIGLPAGAQPRASAPSGWFGNVVLGGETAGFDARKLIVVSFRVAEGSAEVADTTLAYGQLPSLPAASRDYEVVLVGNDGRTLMTRAAPDPRRAIVERRGVTVLDRGLLSVRFAFNLGAARVELRDGEGRRLANADLAGAIESFCRRNSDDPDCRAIEEGRRAGR